MNLTVPRRPAFGECIETFIHSSLVKPGVSILIRGGFHEVRAWENGSPKWAFIVDIKEFTDPRHLAMCWLVEVLMGGEIRGLRAEEWFVHAIV